MKDVITHAVIALMAGTFIMTLPARQQRGLTLKNLAPEGYSYQDAVGCADCKGAENGFMPRAAGMDISGEDPVPDGLGWLASVHARSQSHGDRIDTSCAWCHAPTTPGAARDAERGKAIEKGRWQGVTCSACHPGRLERSQRESLLVNYKPGMDPSRKVSYIFRSRTDGRDMNAQCRFCHHQSHDLLTGKMGEMWEAGELRCIDCHMAAYSGPGQRVERRHNFKVEANLPHSCSGGVGRAAACHEGRSAEWFRENIGRVKGPRKVCPGDRSPAQRS